MDRPRRPASRRTPMILGHLIGDIPALIVAAGVLAFFMRREPSADAAAL